jgi:hypothetical protein
MGMKKAIVDHFSVDGRESEFAGSAEKEEAAIEFRQQFTDMRLEREIGIEVKAKETHTGSYFNWRSVDMR